MQDINYGQLMTGSVVTGVQNTPNVKANAEVENGEYIKFPDGSVAKALGERHEKGGINLILPNMTEVLSNTKDLTISKDIVKTLKKDYDMKNVSTDDTYSKVLDKYARKIGYSKILQEEEDLFNQVKKNTENALSDGSRNINNQYLAQKIYKLQQDKAPLQGELSGMFDKLFRTQQANKSEDEQVVPMIEDELSEEQVFRLGGRVDDFNRLVGNYGLTKQKAYTLLEERGILPKFDGGGVFWGDFEKYQKNYQNIPNYRAGQLSQQANRLSDIIAKAGAEKSLGDYFTGTQQEQDKTAGLYQNWLYNNLPAVAQDYSSTMPPTKQGMQYLVDQGIVTEEDFRKIGVKVPKKAGEVLGFADGQLSEAKIKEVNDIINSKLDSDDKKNLYLRNNFIDNKWFFRAPEVQTVKFKTEEEKENTLKDYTKIGDNVYKSNKTGLYFIPTVEGQPEVVDPAKIRTQELAETPEGTPVDNSPVDIPPVVNRNRLFAMPDQSYLPPMSLQAESMYETELGRLDPVRLGIEDTIRRNQDNTQFLASQLKSLPPTVSAGLMASAIAQSQQSENQAINQIHQINAQNISQAEQFNIRQADLEETTNNASKLNYEQRALLGLSKTDQDLRNFYNAMREVNINNFREQQIMNTMNNLFPQYGIDASGTSVIFDPKVQNYYNPYNRRFNQAMAMQQTPTSTTTKEKKK